AKLTTKDVAALSVPDDNASGWRVFYTLLNQQGGEFLKDGKFLDGDNLDKATTALAEMQKWVKNGWTPAKTEYPASIALFTAGKAAMHINGVWEVLDAVHWFNEHSLEWAGGGHVPAFLPVQESAEFKALKPNSDYVSLAKTAVFDPVSTLAGVASPVYDAAGNYVVPGMSGEMSAADAAKQMRDDLQGQAK